MTAAPQALDPSTRLAVARRTLEERGIRHAPVLCEGRVVGVVSEHDLTICESASNFDLDLRLEDVMTKDVLTVPPSATLQDVTRRMRARHCGSAIVVDHDRVVGIFTTTDALDALADLLDGVCGS
jgi:acetoin utilization protein AcuB